jgi:Ser/Thr protein kinase RdoA (MazF antagonist)
MIPTPDHMREILKATLLQERGPQARLLDWSRDAHFTEHGKRRVVRYDLQVEAGDVGVEALQWLAKIYDRPDEGSRVAVVLRALAHGESGRRGAMAVPRVLAYHPEFRLLLMTYESGESVSSAIARDTAALLAAMGRALAALHGAAVPIVDVHSAAAVLDDLRPRVEELAARLPQEAESLRLALRRLERDGPPQPPILGFVHGDFGPANLLWRPEELVVLDFDKCGRGDPAADLGNLLAQLRRMTVRKPEKLREFAPARAAVLAAYREWSPPDPDLDRRVAWYERAILLRKVHRIALVAAPVSEETTRLLRVCESHAA